MENDLSAKLQIVTRSDPGKVRPHNEDSMFVDPRIGLAILADGMGGYNAGEVAARMATEPLGEALAAVLAFGRPEEVHEDDNGRNWAQASLASQIGRINEAIYQAAASQPQYEGMGTTLVAVLFYDNRVTVAHVGDSRLYRWRDGHLTQLTRDHSLLQEQIDDGIITAEQARQSKSRNLLTRALGVDPVVEVDVGDYEVCVGDLYLLCSDGLTDMLEDITIAATLSEYSTQPGKCVMRLVDMANERGGRDNITVILVRVRHAFPARWSWWDRVLAWFK